ncbi:MAG: NikM domain containing protein [Muricauda sp.]|nr:DUF4198 domain-containing protein [Allomuricauda sp.]MBC31322.1 NikM domain containing protein [Allomuricauda sp.]|tara:strand:+ start:13986 stop:14792 length:807 start_codon:yes stop_codon:yes gene_type:complete
MRKCITFIGLAIVFLLCSSHELFLKSTSYFLEENRAVELFLFNGTFDQSENAIAIDRIVDAKIIGPKFELLPANSAYRLEETSTFLNFTTESAGTYVAGVSTLPRTIDLDAKAFNDYLDHEGLKGTLNERKREGTLKDDATEIYSKHVKAILQVGDLMTDDYKTVLGYPIEFLPIDNPYSKKAGEPIRFQLLLEGKPLAGQTVHYSTSVPGKDAHDSEKSSITDNNGIVTIIPSQSGNWYVATIYMEKSDEEGVDYESNWATLTFGLK